jgi:hypothetical protein
MTVLEASRALSGNWIALFFCASRSDPPIELREYKDEGQKPRSTTALIALTAKDRIHFSMVVHLVSLRLRRYSSIAFFFFSACFFQFLKPLLPERHQRAPQSLSHRQVEEPFLVGWHDKRRDTALSSMM